MSAHSGRSPSVRRCALLLAALVAPLAALPHPHDQAATAASEPPPAEDIPAITVTAERAPPAQPPRITLPAMRSGEQPGEKTLSSIGEFVRQVFGSQAASDARSPSRVANTPLHSGEALHALPRDADRNASPVSHPATKPAQPQAADAHKAVPSMGEHLGSLSARASSTYGPHAVSGVLDYIVNRHCEGIQTASAYGFYNQSSARSPQKPRSSETFADRVSTTLQMFSVTPAQRPPS